MTEKRRPGLLWALVQEWMDSIPYPPSQRKLAARIRVSASAVSDWKYGSGFPEPAALKRLAAEIQVPYERVLDAVLKDRGYRTSPSPAPAPPLGTGTTRRVWPESGPSPLWGVLWDAPPRVGAEP